MQTSKEGSSTEKGAMSTAATAAPLPHPLVTAIDARQSPGPPSPSKEVRDVRLV